MDIRQLRYFLAVVDQGGIGRAATALRVAQPSLSQAIAAFEREVGVPLFHRVGRGLVLSSGGADLVGPARVVLRDLERAESVLTSQRMLASGRLDLITMPSAGIEPFTSVAAAFLGKHPDIVLNVEPANVASEAIRAVVTGRSELGIVGTAEPVRSPGIRAIELGRQPFILVSAPEQRIGGEGPVPLRDLGGLRLVTTQRGSEMRGFADQMIADGIDARIVVEVGHRTSILPLVMSGVGRALLPDAWRGVADRWGADVRDVEPRRELIITAVTRTAQLTPAAEAFLDMAIELSA